MAYLNKYCVSSKFKFIAIDKANNFGRDGFFLFQSVDELIQAIERSRKIFWLKKFSLIFTIILIVVVIPKKISYEDVEEINPTDIEENISPEKNIAEEKSAEINNNTPFNEDAQKLIEFTTPTDTKSSNESQEIKTFNANKNNEKKPRLTLYINGKISKNRGPHTTAGDFILSDSDGWRNWQTTSKGDILYPLNWTLQLKIENFTDRDIIDPRITCHFESTGDNKEFFVDKPTIKSGQTISVELPIANKIALKFLGPNHYSGKLTVGFVSSSEEYNPILIRYVKIKKSPNTQ